MCWKRQRRRWCIFLLVRQWRQRRQRVTHRLARVAAVEEQRHRPWAERGVWRNGVVGDGCVEITSMNHGFAVERESLPANARETHVSLFDGSNCGFELTDTRAFSVQYHPEASPGPQDSHYLFERFVGAMTK